MALVLGTVCRNNLVLTTCRKSGRSATYVRSVQPTARQSPREWPGHGPEDLSVLPLLLPPAEYRLGVRASY
jgi:hypothetical protein